MKKLVRSISVTAMLIAASATLCYAGAWTAKKNTFYEKFAFNYYYADESFDQSGNRQTTPNHGKFTDYDVTNYFEYGLLDNLTFINSLTYKWLYNDTDQSFTKGYGLGDVDLGLRYKILDSDRFGIVSTQLLVKVPGTYNSKDPLPLGNDQVDTEIRFLYGRSLYPWLPAYANLEFGYRWRDGDPSDEIRYLIEFGADFTKELYGRVKLDGTLSLDNGNHVDPNGNPTTTNNFDLGKLDVALGYKITPAWGVELGYRRDIYGQNTAAGDNYSLALIWKTP